MMKKILKVILLGILGVMICLLLTGCGCKHEHISIINQSDPTCEKAGYTGDEYCEDCKKTVKEGTAIDALGHDPRVVNIKDATCSEEGYTGDEYCVRCSKVLSTGIVISREPHTPMAERQNVREATCAAEGYTGDVICEVCGGVIEKGESIPCLPHVPGDRANAVEPSCSESGYTGDVYCTECGKLLESGTVLEQLPHTWGELYLVRESTCAENGYSGDRECSVCGAVEHGSILEKAPHEFDENHVCRNCGWMEPGLYLGEKLEIEWNNLVSKDLVTVENGKLVKISPTLTGTLVIGEDVFQLGSNMMRDSALGAVCIPSSVNKIPEDAFRNSAVSMARFFGPVESIGRGAFSDTKLESFVFPKGIMKVDSDAFVTDTLQSIYFESNAGELESFSLDGARSLRDVDRWPEKLSQLTLSRSDFKELYLPSALRKLGLHNVSNLAVLEAEDTQLDSLDISAGTGLQYISMPKTLTSVNFGSNQGMRYLMIGEGVKQISGQFENLEEIVWPVSYTTTRFNFGKNVKKIYYRGSEAEWKMTSGAAGAVTDETEIVFNSDDKALESFREKMIASLPETWQKHIRQFRQEKEIRDNTVYFTSAEQIPEEMLQKMISAGIRAFIDDAKAHWSGGYIIRTVDYVGNALLSVRDGINGDRNYLYLVYNINFTETDGNDYPFYYLVAYRNIGTDENGLLNKDLTDCQLTRNTYKYNNGKYWLYGYGTLDSLYETMIQPKLICYTCEDNLDRNLDQEIMQKREESADPKETVSAQILPDGDYVIALAANPSLYMDVEGSDPQAKAGSRIHLAEWNRESIQEWDVWTLSYQDGFYIIRQKGTNNCLDIEKERLTPGTDLLVKDGSNRPSQQWIISEDGDGYRLQVRHSGMFLSVRNEQPENGAAIEQYIRLSTDTQRWTFIQYRNENEEAANEEETALGEARVTESLNFREGPSTQYNVISTLNQGTMVTVEGTITVSGTDWAKITVDGKTGYVMKEYLDMGGNAENEETANEEPANKEAANEKEAASGEARVTTRLNFREGPSTKDSVIRALDQGTTVTVEETITVSGTEWAKITVGGKTGYVMKEYLEMIDPE